MRTAYVGRGGVLAVVMRIVAVAAFLGLVAGVEEGAAAPAVWASVVPWVARAVPSAVASVAPWVGEAAPAAGGHLSGNVGSVGSVSGVAGVGNVRDMGSVADMGSVGLLPRSDGSGALDPCRERAALTLVSALAIVATSPAIDRRGGKEADMLELAHRIDHTILKAEATRPEVHQVVAQALEYNFAAVCVNGCFIADVAKALRNSPVKPCAVIGFPLGANKVTAKAIEATMAVKDGAQEIDIVAHLPHLLRRDLEQAKSELLEIVRAARSVLPAVMIKVIVETAVLLQDVPESEGEARIALACQAVRETGCDYIKTSTGFHPAGGATVEAVALLKKHSGGLYVKASGGIRCQADALRMIAAGADRLGCSASVAIVTGK